MPAGLPKRYLSRQEFLDTHVVPWLAEQMHLGEPLEALVNDFGICAKPRAGFSGNSGHTQIDSGIVAVEFSALRDILQDHDNALNAVMEAKLGAEVPDIGDLTQECVMQRWALPDLIATLWQGASYMSMLGPVLRPRWTRLERPIQLELVVQHLVETVQTLEKCVDPSCRRPGPDRPAVERRGR